MKAFFVFFVFSMTLYVGNYDIGLTSKHFYAEASSLTFSFSSAHCLGGGRWNCVT